MVKLLLSSLAACAILAGQTIDGAGVTVQMNGASVLHRTSVYYPAAALQGGVAGTVAVQVKLDSTGNVSDAQILSGPDELRRGVLESVLQWHFTHDAAGTTRSVAITFEPPKPGQVLTVAALPALNTQLRALRSGEMIPPGHVANIRVVGLPDQAVAELLPTLQAHVGEEWSAQSLASVLKAARAYDEHLTVQVGLSDPPAPGEGGITLIVAAPGSSGPGAPGRIKVGGNVQSAQIIRKVSPVYPADAKAAHISGVVRLAAIIGKDGGVVGLTVLSGPPELAQASLDAVSQWVYRPTMLNGAPVDVETTIDINYTLSQ